MCTVILCEQERAVKTRAKSTLHTGHVVHCFTSDEDIPYDLFQVIRAYNDADHYTASSPLPIVNSILRSEICFTIMSKLQSYLIVSASMFLLVNIEKVSKPLTKHWPKLLILWKDVTVLLGQLSHWMKNIQFQHLLQAPAGLGGQLLQLQEFLQKREPELAACSATVVSSAPARMILISILLLTTRQVDGSLPGLIATSPLMKPRLYGSTSEQCTCSYSFICVLKVIVTMGLKLFLSLPSTKKKSMVSQLQGCFSPVISARRHSPPFLLLMFTAKSARLLTTPISVTSVPRLSGRRPLLNHTTYSMLRVQSHWCTFVMFVLTNSPLQQRWTVTRRTLTINSWSITVELALIWI